jgi:hypothetical protein
MWRDGVRAEFQTYEAGARSRVRYVCSRTWLGGEFGVARRMTW